MVRFVWDPEKNESNFRKHGVRFEEAKAVFEAPDLVEILDEEHSEAEERFWAMAVLEKGLTVVVYAEQVDDAIRLISARRGTRGETRKFLKFWGRDG